MGGGTIFFSEIGSVLASLRVLVEVPILTLKWFDCDLCFLQEYIGLNEDLNDNVKKWLGRRRMAGFGRGSSAAKNPGGCHRQ